MAPTLVLNSPPPPSPPPWKDGGTGVGEGNEGRWQRGWERGSAQSRIRWHGVCQASGPRRPSRPRVHSSRMIRAEVVCRTLACLGNSCSDRSRSHDRQCTCHTDETVGCVPP